MQIKEGEHESGPKQGWYGAHQGRSPLLLANNERVRFPLHLELDLSWDEPPLSLLPPFHQLPCYQLIPSFSMFTRVPVSLSCSWPPHISPDVSRKICQSLGFGGHHGLVLYSSCRFKWWHWTQHIMILLLIPNFTRVIYEPLHTLSLSWEKISYPGYPSWLCPLWKGSSLLLSLSTL